MYNVHAFYIWFFNFRWVIFKLIALILTFLTSTYQRKFCYLDILNALLKKKSNFCSLFIVKPIACCPLTSWSRTSFVYIAGRCNSRYIATARGLLSENHEHCLSHKSRLDLSTHEKHRTYWCKFSHQSLFRSRCFSPRYLTGLFGLCLHFW